MKKFKEIVNNHLNSVFKKFGGKSLKNLDKLDDKIVETYDNWLIKKGDYEYLGEIGTKDLETNKNIKIKIFIISTKKMPLYTHAIYNRADNEIHINVNFLKFERRHIISKIAHEVIHGIQKFKERFLSRYKPEKQDYESNFLYYTESMEFDAQMGELMFSIEEFFESSDELKRKEILYVLKDFLKRNKEYIQNINWLKISKTFKELFLNGITLLDLHETKTQMNLSHVAARQELNQLLDCIQLPKSLKKVA
jgi:hypothetical protein